MPPVQGPPLGNVPTGDSYLRLKQNIDALQQSVDSMNASVSVAPSAVIQGTHLARIRAGKSALSASLFFETDRQIIYISSGNGWVYAAGAYSDRLANIPRDLTAADAGLLFSATDYAHQYLWSGNNWSFAPGDPGSAYVVTTGGSSPMGGNWTAANGTGTFVATPAGNTASVTMPTVTNGWFRR